MFSQSFNINQWEQTLHRSLERLVFEGFQPLTRTTIPRTVFHGKTGHGGDAFTAGSILKKGKQR